MPTAPTGDARSDKADMAVATLSIIIGLAEGLIKRPRFQAIRLN